MTNYQGICRFLCQCWNLVCWRQLLKYLILDGEKNVTQVLRRVSYTYYGYQASWEKDSCNIFFFNLKNKFFCVCAVFPSIFVLVGTGWAEDLKRNGGILNLPTDIFWMVFEYVLTDSKLRKHPPSVLEDIHWRSWRCRGISSTIYHLPSLYIFRMIYCTVIGAPIGRFSPPASELHLTLISFQIRSLLAKWEPFQYSFCSWRYTLEIMTVPRHLMVWLITRFKQGYLNQKNVLLYESW